MGRGDLGGEARWRRFLPGLGAGLPGLDDVARRHHVRPFGTLVYRWMRLVDRCGGAPRRQCAPPWSDWERALGKVGCR